LNLTESRRGAADCLFAKPEPRERETLLLAYFKQYKRLFDDINYLHI